MLAEIGLTVATVGEGGVVIAGGRTAATEGRYLANATEVAAVSDVGASEVPSVVDERLANIVDNVFKGVSNPNRFGDGTLMAAVRYEIETGELVFGRNHVQKAQDVVRALSKWIKNPPGGALAADSTVAVELREQLRAALGYEQ